jgi:DNA-binding transcriptional ArsR family regulator
LSVLKKIQALSNETRFEIVRLAREHEMSAGEIASRFKLTRPAVSQHLSTLRAAGLLNERRVGTQRLYTVRAEGFDELAEYVEVYWRPRLQKLKLAAEAAERKKRNE